MKGSESVDVFLYIMLILIFLTVGWEAIRSLSQNHVSWKMCEFPKEFEGDDLIFTVSDPVNYARKRAN